MVLILHPALIMTEGVTILRITSPKTETIIENVISDSRTAISSIGTCNNTEQGTKTTPSFIAQSIGINRYVLSIYYFIVIMRCNIIRL